MQRGVNGVGGNLLDAHLHQLTVLNLAACVQVVGVLLARARQNQRLGAVQLLRAGVQRNVVSRNNVHQPHVDGHVRRHAAQLVDELLKLHEVHVQVILRGDAGELGNFALKRLDAGDVVHLVQLHLLAVVLGGRVARDGNQSYRIGFRVDARKHQHVAAAGAVGILRLRDLNRARARVVAHDHHVERLRFGLSGLHAVGNLKRLVLVNVRLGLLLAPGQQAQRKRAAGHDRQNPLPCVHSRFLPCKSLLRNDCR